MITLNETDIKEIIKNILFEYRAREQYPSNPRRGAGFSDDEFKKNEKKRFNKLKEGEHERHLNNIIKYILKGLSVQASIDTEFENRNRLKKITINDFANTLTPEEVQMVKDAVKKVKENKIESEKYLPIINKQLNDGKHLEEILSDLNITEDYLKSILTGMETKKLFFLTTKKYNKQLY